MMHSIDDMTRWENEAFERPMTQTFTSIGAVLYTAAI